MESGGATTIGSSSFFVAIAVCVGLAAGFIAYTVLSKRYTVPSGTSSEGFQGPTQGVSTIRCGQESAHAIAIVEMLDSKISMTEEGAPDLTEFKLILSKLCCLKHDLMSTAQVVQGMLYMPYSNTHDRENPADTVGRCFTKSIPMRDLTITFSTWKDRGIVLLNKLCTSYSLSSSESDEAMRHFNALWSDVFQIAKNGCIATKEDPTYASPRDPRGFTPDEIQDLGAYKGYY